MERGFAADCSAVTVVGAAGPFNMSTHAKDGATWLRVIGDSMAYPAGNDYINGVCPWLILSPEHAQVLRHAGLTKAEVKRGLWESSKLAARRMAPTDLERTQNARRAELGEIGPDTMLPISVRPEDIGIIVAGGPATHSLYITVFPNSRSVTREITA